MQGWGEAGVLARSPWTESILNGKRESGYRKDKTEEEEEEEEEFE